MDILGLVAVRYQYYEVTTIDDFIFNTQRSNDDPMLGSVSPDVAVMFMITNEEQTAQSPDLSCESGCSYRLNVYQKLISLKVRLLTVNLPKLSENSKLDKKRFEDVYNAISKHEQGHVSKYLQLDANYNDLLNRTMFSFEVKICVGATPDEVKSIVKNADEVFQENFLKAVADKMTRLVHEEIGDSFEFSKIEAYLKGERDDFR